MLLVSGGVKSIGPFIATGRIGALLTPLAGNSVDTTVSLGVPWAADNAAFSGFDEAKFMSLLRRIGDRKPLWVAAPDVVQDSRATMALWPRWHAELSSRGLPAALVAQDGLEDLGVPWDELACLFIGGSTEWKQSTAARGLVAEAKARGKSVHMGRVNTRRRFELAYDWGCDTVDGTAFSMYPAIKIPLAMRWLEETEIFHNTNGRMFQ